MEIRLIKFDKDFYNSLSEKNKILYNPTHGTYHTILLNDMKVGIIGYIYFSQTKEKYLQVLIKENFKRKGIFKESLNLLMKKYNIKKITSTINKENNESITSHEKNGFIQIPKNISKFEKLRPLHKTQIRYVKFDKPYPNISFPNNEIKDYIEKLNNDKICSTTRILKEKDKYIKGNIYQTNWYDLIKIIRIDKFDNIKDHPYYNELSEKNIKEINSNEFEVIHFIKVS